MKFMGIYLELGDQLAEARFLSGDDTPAKVLDTSDCEEPDVICDVIDALFGWRQKGAVIKAQSSGQRGFRDGAAVSLGSR